MTAHLLRRLGQAMITIWGAVTVVFVVTRVLPGDPVSLMVGEAGGEAEIAAARERLGLDEPIPAQYLTYLSMVVRLDLGDSFVSRIPVVDLISDRLPATAQLAAAAAFLAILIGVPTGVMAALRVGSRFDGVVSKLSLAAQSVPAFWVGIMFLLVFARWLGWLPSLGRGTVAHLILPAITLALPLLAILVRLTRQGMLEVVNSNYIETARAKGLGERAVIVGHALKNMLIPVVTVIGLQLGDLLTGAVIVETVFSWPGLGSLVVSSIFRHDYPVVQALMIFAAALFVLINLTVDLLYGVLDPRVRLERV